LERIFADELRDPQDDDAGRQDQGFRCVSMSKRSLSREDLEDCVLESFEAHEMTMLDDKIKASDAFASKRLPVQEIQH